jgi:acetoacetyl-CoA synthetase
MACRAAGIVPRVACDLSALESVGSTGAPLPASGFQWVYEQVSPDVLLASVSGGTDLCTAFVASCPLLPVYAGELQCAALGASVEAFDEAGNAVVGQVGELVITQPMPCMPIGFWNDPDGERYRQSYFEDFPGVWRHGDWIELTSRGTAIISGRSDATLNRGGVRMGSSEFYRVVEELDFIEDSLVVDTSGTAAPGQLWLFVVLSGGAGDLDETQRSLIVRTVREKLSPRHVPDEIRCVPEVPRTLSGKKLEVPIKRLLSGDPLERVVNPGTLKNPQALVALVRSAGLELDLDG